MGSGTELVHSKLKRQKSKSPALEDKSTNSYISPTKGKNVSSLCTKVPRGYVESSTESGPGLGLNRDFKPSEKCGKYTVDVSAKKKKRQFDGNKTQSSCRNLIREHTNKRKESKRFQKLSDFKVEDNITNLKLKRGIKKNEEITRSYELCYSEETSDRNWTLKRGNKKFKEAVGSNLNHSETKSTIKLGHKRRKKLHEAVIKTQKINNSDLINILGNTSPLVGPERSRNFRIENAAKFEHKRRKKRQEAVDIEKLSNSEEEDDDDDDDANFKLTFSDKHNRDAFQIKKLNNSTAESTMKVEHKPRNKSLVEDIKIKKSSNPEKMSSVTSLKSSQTVLLDKVIDSVTSFKYL
jgi:hypothetical protein